MATLKLNCKKDVSISEKYSGNPYNASDRLAFGRGAASGDRYYALLGFDALSLDFALYKITKAVLTVTKIQGAVGFDASMNARAQRITSSWSETTTWSGRPGTTTTGQSAAKSTGDGYSGTMSFDVTKIVQAWQSGSGQYGIQLMQSDSTASRIKCIADRTTSNAAYITVTYEQREPAPSTPILTSPGTITEDSKTFSWKASTDNIFPSSSLSYQLQVSLDGGNTWSASYSVAANTTQLAVNLRTAAGLKSGQYYYNTKLQVRVRAVTPAFNGTIYYSAWGVSDVGAVDYRITPTAPGSLTSSLTEVYEGQSITITLDRPSKYNAYDSDGATMQLTYTVKLKDGTVLGRITAACTSTTASMTVTMPNKTIGTADLSTTMTATVTDAEGQIGPSTAAVALTIKRYRAPVVTIIAIDRSATSATATVQVTNTGYGGTQSNAQITTVEYSLDGAAWVKVTPTWIGLKTAVELTGLAEGSRYSLQIRVTNAAPDGMTAKASTTAAANVLEYTPAAMIYRDNTNGATGIAAKGLIVGTDWSQQVEEGDAMIEGTLTVAALDVGGDWVELTIAEGFAAYADAAASRPQYKVCGNVVTIKGVLTPTADLVSGTSNVVIASGIPAELRPTTNPVFVCQGSGMNRWACTVLSNGNIGLARYGTTEATTVPAGAWLPFCVTYMI